jgi:hypothetical protein
VRAGLAAATVSVVGLGHHWCITLHLVGCT